MGRAESYRTILAVSEGIVTEKRSKFISYAIPVSSESEAMRQIEAYRKKYYDARHVCWAYRIGKSEFAERSNDDGEPSSTAGKPILGQIHSFGLTDVLVLVIRYFGGVKLGTGGLIAAYRSAAEEALKAAKVVEHTLYTGYELSFPFDLINPVMMLLKEHKSEVLANDADVDGHVWKIRVANKSVDLFEQEAETIYRLRIKRDEE